MYRVQQNPMTEAAIDTGLTRDLYVSLGEPVEGSRAWIVRVYVKPFVDWIWGGCLLMAWAACSPRPTGATAPRCAASRRAAMAAAGASGMKSLRFLLPLAHLPGAAWPSSPSGLKLDPREVPSPLIGKPAPAFALTRLDDAGADDHARGNARQGLDAERLGLVVRAVPRGAPAAGRLRASASCVPIYGLNYKDTRPAGMGWLAQLRQPVRRLAVRQRRPRRHRLRRLRRARDLRHRQAGRDPPQADRPAHARGAAHEDRAAAEGTQCLSCFLAGCSRCCWRLPLAAGAKEAAPAVRRPGARGARDAHRRRTALPGLPEPDHRRLHADLAQ